jgi:hypothetical protein
MKAPLQAEGRPKKGDRTQSGARLTRPSAGSVRHHSADQGTPLTQPSTFSLRPFAVGSGLAALLGLTAWAVASVSAWLVPVYLLLVVLILAAPQGARGSSRSRNSDASIAETGWDSGESRANGRGHAGPRPDADDNPTVPSGEVDDVELDNLRLDPAANAVTKPRRGRARSRKVTRPAVEPAPDSVPVTWIRVGPGKYVRSDSMDPGQPSAEACSSAEVEPPTEVLTSTEVEIPSPTDVEIQPPAEAQAPVEPPAVGPGFDPATDRPEPATTEFMALAEARPAPDDVPEPEASTSDVSATDADLETVPPVAALVATNEVAVAEAHPASVELETEPTEPEVVPDASPNVEEYGIAPSAFSATTADPYPSESPDSLAYEPTEPFVVEPETVWSGPCEAAASGCLADLGAPAPGTGRTDDQPRQGRRQPKTFSLLVPRSPVNRSCARETPVRPLGRDVRGPVRPRAALQRSSGRDPRREDAARRAFGRTDHVRRNRRARSPPGAL